VTSSPTPATVLVVDDDPNLQRVLKKFLTLEGFTPVVAGNGAEALSYLRSGGDASVILLDLRMPVMDGWTFRREQRLDPGIAGIPVVVLSGTDAEGVDDLEVAATFHKPASFTDIIGVLRQLCSVTH
jgi:CheY-like chemotaxis protein